MQDPAVLPVLPREDDLPVGWRNRHGTGAGERVDGFLQQGQRIVGGEVINLAFAQGMDVEQRRTLAVAARFD